MAVVESQAEAQEVYRHGYQTGKIAYCKDRKALFFRPDNSEFGYFKVLQFDIESKKLNGFEGNARAYVFAYAYPHIIGKPKDDEPMLFWNGYCAPGEITVK